MKQLSVYLKLAGPLGRALDAFSSWTIGVGRFFLPLLCIGLGVALEYMMGLGMENIAAHERRLRDYARDKLAGL